jgi:peptide/nickel transport system substrate-binding protein
LLSGSLSRRGFLGTAAGVTLGLALDACGGSSNSKTKTSSQAAQTPKHGGTLTIAASGGGSGDSLNPYTAITETSYMGSSQLYEGLLRTAPDASPVFTLAEALEPNKDGTEWTIHLRSGVEWHDGRPFTSADVIATLRRWVKGAATASASASINAAGAKALDTHTVRVPMHLPFFVLPDILTSYALLVTPADWNPARPVGTGPFKYVAFSPGRQMSFARNPNYWMSGKPYVDTVLINSFSDETAQVSALQSGAANVANSFSHASAQVLQTSGVKLLTSITRGANLVGMNLSTAPFSDVRVRQALKFVVGRPQMAQDVFGPYAKVANDSFCAPFDPLHVPLPQRQQDFGQAKSLLAAAGHSGLTTTLVSAPVAQGIPEMAQVFVQQAKGAGVNVMLDEVTTDVIYGPKFTHWPFAMTYGGGDGYLLTLAEVMLPNSSYPETHFNNARFTKLYYEALAAPTLSLRREIAGEMQKIEYEQGGYIVPVFRDIIDASAATVHGIQEGYVSNNFNNYDLRNAWIE